MEKQSEFGKLEVILASKIFLPVPEPRGFSGGLRNARIQFNIDGQKGGPQLEEET